MLNPSALSPWGPMAAVVLLLVTLLAALAVLQRRYALDAEAVRKALHVAMGASALAFPWAFADARPVWALAAVTAGAMLAVRRSAALRARVGAVVHGVARRSVGDIAFPFGVASAFSLCEGRPAAYLVAVGALALADPAAALAGARWGGRWGWGAFRAPGGRKTLEGTTACALAAFAVAAAVLAGAGVPGALGLACAVAFAVASAEAATGHGLDNVTLPLAAAFVLAGSPGEAWARAAFVTTLSAGVLVVANVRVPRVRLALPAHARPAFAVLMTLWPVGVPAQPARAPLREGQTVRVWTGTEEGRVAGRLVRLSDGRLGVRQEGRAFPLADARRVDVSVRGTRGEEARRAAVVGAATGASLMAIFVVPALVTIRDDDQRALVVRGGLYVGGALTAGCVVAFTGLTAFVPGSRWRRVPSSDVVVIPAREGVGLALRF